MKKMWKLTAGAASVVVLLSAYYVLKDFNTKQETAADQESEQDAAEVFAVNEDELRRIQFTLEDGDVSFKKEEDSWINEEDADFPLDQDKVSTLIEQLCSFSADRVLENVDNLSEYGLQEPSNTISVKGENQEIMLHIGDKNESTGQYYVNLEDSENTVYVVKSSQITPFQGKLYDFAKGETFPVITSGDVKRIQVDKEEDPYILQTSDLVSSGWLVGDNADELEDADSGNAYTLLASIGTLSYGEFVDYKCDDLSKYGLDTPTAILTVDYEEVVPRETEGDDSLREEESATERETDENTSLFIEDESESDEPALEDESASGEQTSEEKVEKKMVLTIGDACDNGYYVNLQGTDQVYTMGSDDLSSIIDKSAGDFWNLIVSYIPIDEIEEFKAEDQNSSVTISVKEENVESDLEEDTNGMTDEESIENESEKEKIYYSDGKKIESTSFRSFYSVVVNVGAQQRLEDIYEPDGDSEIGFSFKKQNGDLVTLSYYPYDNNFYVAMRSDGKNYLVNKMTVKDLKESLNEFISSVE